MAADLQVWSSKLAAWASGKPQIAEVWLFGSRVRGDHRADSDLDVALIMSGVSKGSRYGNWLALADVWEQELKGLFPIAIDLDIGDDDISCNVVAPTLKREGIRIYSRTEKQ